MGRYLLHANAVVVSWFSFPAVTRCSWLCVGFCVPCPEAAAWARGLWRQRSPQVDWRCRRPRVYSRGERGGGQKEAGKLGAEWCPLPQGFSWTFSFSF